MIDSVRLLCDGWIRVELVLCTLAVRRTWTPDQPHCADQSNGIVAPPCVIETEGGTLPLLYHSVMAKQPRAASHMTKFQRDVLILVNFFPTVVANCSSQ